MKRMIVAVIGLVVIIIASLWMFYLTPNQLIPGNPSGKTVYYTKVTGSGVPDTDGRFKYEATAYTAKGAEKILQFTAGKQLREGAYLQLYHTRLRGVTYWEEVEFEKLPESVQKRYQ